MRTLQSLAFAVLALVAVHADAVRMPRDAEAGMRVEGTIDVAADGSVTRHAIDHPELLDAGVVRVIETSMTDWHFKPMRTPAHATMRLAVHAKKNDAGQYRIWIADADFSTPQEGASWRVDDSKAEVDYPDEAVAAGVGGRVYLALHVSSQGNLIEAFIEQVDLDSQDKPDRMDHWRDVLGAFAVASAKKWIFYRPQSTTAATPNDTGVTLRTFFECGIDRNPQQKYGKWRIFIPGPRHPIPWLTADRQPLGGMETLPAGEFLFPADRPDLQLQTPPSTKEAAL